MPELVAPVPVPHLCPSLAAVARIVRKHTPVGHPDRAEAMRLLREAQDGAEQLRANATHWQGLADQRGRSLGP